MKNSWRFWKKAVWRNIRILRLQMHFTRCGLCCFRYCIFLEVKCHRQMSTMRSVLVMVACWHVLAAMFIRKKCFLQSMGFTQESVKKRLFGQNGSWLHTRSSGFHFSICCRTLYTAGHFRLRRCLRMPCGHRYRWAVMRRNAE